MPARPSSRTIPGPLPVSLSLSLSSLFLISRPSSLPLLFSLLLYDRKIARSIRSISWWTGCDSSADRPTHGYEYRTRRFQTGGSMIELYPTLSAMPDNRCSLPPRFPADTIYRFILDLLLSVSSTRNRPANGLINSPGRYLLRAMFLPRDGIR